MTRLFKKSMIEKFIQPSLLHLIARGARIIFQVMTQKVHVFKVHIRSRGNFSLLSKRYYEKLSAL